MKKYIVLFCVGILLTGIGSGYTQEKSARSLICELGERPIRASKLKVKEGDLAPNFTLPSVSGEEVTLSNFRGKKNVIISFVPAAWTSVCSDQWTRYGGFQDAIEAYDAVLLGVSVDNLPTLRAWTNGLGDVWFTVLSDFWPHGVASKRFGVFRSDGISERAVFIIDKEGVVQYAMVNPINRMIDASEIVSVLERLNRIQE